MACGIAISAVPRMMKPRDAVLSRRKKGNAALGRRLQSDVELEEEEQREHGLLDLPILAVQKRASDDDRKWLPGGAATGRSGFESRSILSAAYLRHLHDGKKAEMPSPGP